MRYHIFHDHQQRSTNTWHVQRGTTLVEMIIYIGIVSILLVGVGAVSMSAIESKTKTRAMSEVLSGGTDALALITQLVRENLTIESPLVNATSSTLILSNKTSSSTTRVYADHNILYLQNGSSTPLAITTNDTRVDTISFTGFGNTSTTSTGVRITVGISASTTGIWQTYQYGDTFTTAEVLGAYR